MTPTEPAIYGLLAEFGTANELVAAARWPGSCRRSYVTRSRAPI